MIKKNRLKLLICSLLIILPILFGVFNWNNLPDVLATHWGIDGQADGFSSKTFAVFFLPLLLLSLFWLCVIFEAKNRKNFEENEKALNAVLWIIPVISLVVNGVVYLTALGFEASSRYLIPAVLAMLFIVIGNYMPKCKQNKTLGIKIKWTLENEENWNATHRFAGKVWFFGGFAVIACSILPENIFPFLIFIFIFGLVFAPVFYSLHYHKKQLKNKNGRGEEQ